MESGRFLYWSKRNESFFLRKIYLINTIFSLNILAEVLDFIWTFYLFWFDSWLSTKKYVKWEKYKIFHLPFCFFLERIQALTIERRRNIAKNHVFYGLYLSLVFTNYCKTYFWCHKLNYGHRSQRLSRKSFGTVLCKIYKK